MQIQKDEVRNKILNSAIEEFKTLGYEKSSMRVIAAKSGITVGNIYSYFKSKEDLFENIVYKTVTQIKELILMDISKSSNKITKTSAIEITNQIIKVFLNNRQEFLILMNSAKGSKYENIKSVIKEEIRERLIIDLLPLLAKRAENEIFADTLSLILLDGISNIVLKSENDYKLMNKLIYDFLLLLFGDIENRLV